MSMGLLALPVHGGETSCSIHNGHITLSLCQFLLLLLLLLSLHHRL